MPHVVLDTSSPLHEIVDRMEPFVRREGETVWRMRDTYLNSDERHALAECLVVSSGRPNRLFVHLSQREKDASVVVRPYPLPRVERTPSVKRMVALVAECARAAHPDVAIGSCTISEFLSDRYTYAPDPETGGSSSLLTEETLSTPLSWQYVFGVDGPVEIEIGSGKGTFLVESAIARPETLFLSIEYADEYARHLAARVRRRNLRNVRVVRADAGRFLEDAVPEGSVAALHVYFPDPWPKKRHHKRRLVQPPFAAAVARALAAGGEIRFVTDHAEYFEEAIAVFEAEPGLRSAAVPGEMADLTNYERKYRAEGRPIYRARFCRA